jgi:hypothetical protein
VTASESHARSIDDHHLAGLKLTLRHAADGPERACFAGHHVPVAQAARSERADTARIAKPDQELWRHDGDAVGAANSSHHLAHGGFGSAIEMPHQHAGEDLGIAGGVEVLSRGLHFSAEFLCVDDVSVVGHRDLAHHALAKHRLSVSEDAGPGGAVSGVADRHVALKALKHVGGEYLADQAHVLVVPNPRAVADGDACRLLASVLEREQAEERGARRVSLR